MTVTVHYQTLRGTPVFVTGFDDPGLQRVYGFQLNKATGLCLYPAFYPFGQHVVQDFRVVLEDDLQFTDAAAERVAQLEVDAQRAADQWIPESMTWHTNPYDHQRESVAQLVNNLRWGLFLDCGLGKTKAALDAYRAIREIEPDAKLLALMPGHLPRVWEREAQVHGGGEIDVLALIDDVHNKTLSPADRLELYTGEREVEPDPGTWFAGDYPDVLYSPLDRSAPAEMLEREAAYLAACHAEDGDEMARLRSQLRYRAKKFDVELPEPARKLRPPLRPIWDYDVVVCSHGLARKPDPDGKRLDDVEWLMKSFPYTIIASDESHSMRGYRSNRTKAMWRLSTIARRRWIMSGTPALGEPLHLYGQLRFLGKFITQDWWTFSRRYVTYMDRGDYQMPVSYKNLHVLNEITTEVSTRKKAEDCLDLPDLKILTRDVPVDAETKRIYNGAIDDMVADLQGREVSMVHAADLLQKLFQILSGFIIDSNVNHKLCEGCPFLLRCEANEIQPYTPDCKVAQERPPKTTVRLGPTPRLDHLKGLLGEILSEPTNKVIVWCTFREELEMVQEMLEAEAANPKSDLYEVGHVRVDGTTKNSVAAQDRFNQDPTCRVYVAQVATGIGVTLNAANYTVYYGVTYSLDHYIQSMKRNHRSGQKRKVTVYLMQTPGSVHEYVFRALERKQDISATLTDDIRCATCERSLDCELNMVRPFEDDCVYDKKAKRVVTRPAKL